MEGFAFLRCFPKVFIAPGICQLYPLGLCREEYYEWTFGASKRGCFKITALRSPMHFSYWSISPFFSSSTPSLDLQFCGSRGTLGIGNGRIVWLKCEYPVRQNSQPCRVKLHSSIQLYNVYGSLLLVKTISSKNGESFSLSLEFIILKISA